MTDMVFGIAGLNAAEAVGMAGVGASVEGANLLYPIAMTAAGTPQGQRLLENASDVISAAIPSTSPKANLAGLAGHITGEYIGKKF